MLLKSGYFMGGDMRFYFHFNGMSGHRRDLEGMELEDLAAAHLEAWVGIRDIVAERLKLGRTMDQSDTLEIHDSSGRSVQSISFHEVIRFYS